jgi:uncharacterized protein
VHCAGMCGGIAASLCASARGPTLARQIAFNGGRIAAYAVAGAVFGGVGATLRWSAALQSVQVALFVAANVLMIFLGLYVAGWGRAVLHLESAGGPLWRSIAPLRARLFPVDSSVKAVIAGMVWGFVPCGLVYSMLALALASGGSVPGAAVMLAFGLGTLPNLLAAGLAAQRLLAIRRYPWLRRSAGMGIVVLAAFGLAGVPQVRELALSGWMCL